MDPKNPDLEQAMPIRIRHKDSPDRTSTGGSTDGDTKSMLNHRLAISTGTKVR